MRRAWRPTWLSPISPSISALGTRAATESMTTMSIAPERISMSMISRACSPVSGWETSSASVSTPSFCAYSGSSACSASMNAAMPPRLLRVRDGVQRHGGLTVSSLGRRSRRCGRAGAADAEGHVEGDRAGGDHLDRDARLLAEPHDRALAELPLDLEERGLECLALVAGPVRDRCLTAWCHGDSLSFECLSQAGCDLRRTALEVPTLDVLALEVLRPLPTPHTLRVTTDIPGPHGVSGQPRSAKRVTDARRPTFTTIGERLFDRGQDTPARSIDYGPSCPLATGAPVPRSPWCGKRAV